MELAYPECVVTDSERKMHDDFVYFAWRLCRTAEGSGWSLGGAHDAAIAEPNGHANARIAEGPTVVA